MNVSFFKTFGVQWDTKDFRCASRGEYALLPQLISEYALGFILLAAIFFKTFVEKKLLSTTQILTKEGMNNEI